MLNKWAQSTIFSEMAKDNIYFDYASTTPVSEAAFNAMKPYFSEKFGNAGSVHSFGQEAIAAIDKSREIVANELNADFREIIFTGSATEANNLALRGAVSKWKRDFKDKIPRIIVSAIEHDSVLEAAKDLAENGAELKIVKVDKDGVIDLNNLKEVLTSNTAIVSVMFGNNEIGSIQPVKQIGEIIKKFKEEEGARATEFSRNIYPLFHTDASQAFQYLECDVRELGVNLLTISSHKIYGPKGVGALFVERFQRTKGFYIQPVSFGGDQEFGMRPGTENVPGIVGFAAAAAEASKIRGKEARRVLEIKQYFESELQKINDKLEINGSTEKSLPHILSVYFPKNKAEEIITALDLKGFAVSAGSACRARAVAPSYVVEALGYREERSVGSVRFSFGRDTDKNKVKKLLTALKELI